MALRSKKRRRPQSEQQRLKVHYRTNEQIRASQLRVVDERGEPVGVMSREEALTKAREEEKDLVEISPKADPPVAKIVDYGKMLYSLKKKEHQAKKSGKALEQKGIRLTFRMGEGDLDRQRKHTQAFLEKGHPVKLQLIMKGRENAHKDIAVEKMKAFVASLEEFGKTDQIPRAAGFQIVIVLKPVQSGN